MFLGLQRVRGLSSSRGKKGFIRNVAERDIHTIYLSICGAEYRALPFLSLITCMRVYTRHQCKDRNESGEMEPDEIQCKFPRIGNGNGNGRMTGDEEDDDRGNRTRPTTSGRVRGVDLGGVGSFYGWPSSRIVRVSRASGGNDRHSKVLTSKGLRDRRVRLSVNTAIQFYDLQDRLGYDQPSKAVEWLLKAAASSIAELPPMCSPFPDTPKQMNDEKRSSTGGSDQVGFDSAEVDMDSNYCLPAAKSSACSSNSETSKGSGLSLSRSESRIRARERAKERVAEKERGGQSPQIGSVNPNSATTSFTELLNGHQNPNSSAVDSSFVLRSPMDYFNCGLAGSPPRSTPMVNPFANTAGPEHHQELLQFSFLPDHLVPVGSGHSGGELSLNFSISSSSGLSCFNRGTLQSNSSLPSYLLPHFQRFPDGSPSSFFIGAATPPVDNHNHQFLSGYDTNTYIGGQKGIGKS